MSPNGSADTAPADAQTHDSRAEAGPVLDLLADDDMRALFHRSGEPKTIPELGSECDLPRSTVYRKAKRLIEANLLVATTKRTGDTDGATAYRRTVEGIEIEIGDATTVDFVV